MSHQKNAKSSPPPEEVELEKLLTNFDVDMCAAYAIEDNDYAIDNSGNREASHRAIIEARKKAKQALLRWREAYADKRVIEELERQIKEAEVMWEWSTIDLLKDRISALRKVNEGEV